MTKIVRSVEGAEPWDAEYFSFSQPVKVTTKRPGGISWSRWALGYAVVLDDECPGTEFLLEGGSWAGADHWYLEEFAE